MSGDWREAFFALSRDLFSIVDTSGKFHEFNPAWETVLGWTPEELRSMSAWELMHPDDIPSTEDLRDREESDVDHFENRYRHRDGSYRWLSWTASRHADGLYYSVARDITEQRKSKQDLQAVISQAPVVIFRVEADGILSMIEGRGLEPLGTDWELLEGKSVFESFVDQPDITANIRRALDGESHVADVSYGDLVFEVSYAPVLEGDLITGVIGVSTDITGRKLAEKKVAELASQVRVQQRLEAIGTLASGVAHEINNPLHAVINYAVLLKEEIESTEGEEFLDIMMAELERILAIVSHLLTFSRQDTEETISAPVGSILESVQAFSSIALDRDHIQLDISVEPDLPEILCRPQQIKQVLHNLITNANHALNERYPEHDKNKAIRIRVSALTDGRGVRIQVEDRGAGIEPGIEDRVFDPFFTTKAPGVGTGLGLSVSHEIIEEHGGKIWVETEPGEATSFFVELPVSTGPDG